MASVTKREWTSPKGEPKEAWLVRYVDAGGKHRGKQFQRKKEADTYRQKVEREITDGTHIAPRASATLNETIDDYLASIDQQVKAGAWRETGYWREESWLRLYVKPTLGNVRLCDLAAPQISNLIASLRTGRGRLGRPISPLTANHAVAALARVLDFAMRRKWIVGNPAREARNWKENRFKRERIRLFDLGEIHQLVGYFADPAKHNDKWGSRNASLGRCLVFLALFGGLRSGEARGIAADAIDLPNRVLHVRQALDDRVRISPPKTAAGVRTVPMAEPLALALEEWIARHHTTNALGLLFTTRNGSPVCHSNMHNNIWKRALTDLGLVPDERGRWYHFHALRHFASAIMVKHMPLADVPSIMGHAHFDTTLMEYAQPVLTAPAKQAAFALIANDLAPLEQPRIAHG